MTYGQAYLWAPQPCPADAGKARGVTPMRARSVLTRAAEHDVLRLELRHHQNVQGHFQMLHVIHGSEEITQT